MPALWGNMAALRAAAENLTDAIQARVAAENRAQRGGIAVGSMQDRLLHGPREAESEARNLLQAVYAEEVPGDVRDWVSGIPGLKTGEVFPRLIGVVGNPAIATPYKWEAQDGQRVLVADGEPYARSLRQLWAWCGCGDPLRRPASGMSQADLMACGRRTSVRPLLFTFSSYISRAGRVVTKEGSAKQGQPMSQAAADSRYFQAFTTAKEAGMDKKHQDECRNHKRPPMRPDGCGTVAHPEWGEAGSPWRAGHAEAHAHRIVAKEFLRDLWVVANSL